MENGDISNDTPPRWFVVFEGLVGELSSERRMKEKFHRTLHQWKQAAALWDINDTMVSHLWDAVWRWQQPVDLITYLPEPYADAMQTRLDRLNVPTGNFMVFSSPDELAHRLPHMPNVRRVIYASPDDRPFLFGGRGLMLSGPEGIMAWTSNQA